MFDRVRIWDDERGFVRIEIKDDNGVLFYNTSMPAGEWYALRDKQIQTYPRNVSVSLLTDLVTVLAIAIESI